MTANDFERATETAQGLPEALGLTTAALMLLAAALGALNLMEDAAERNGRRRDAGGGREPERHGIGRPATEAGKSRPGRPARDQMQSNDRNA